MSAFQSSKPLDMISSCCPALLTIPFPELIKAQDGAGKKKKMIKKKQVKEVKESKKQQPHKMNKGQNKASKKTNYSQAGRGCGCDYNTSNPDPNLLSPVENFDVIENGLNEMFS